MAFVFTPLSLSSSFRGCRAALMRRAPCGQRSPSIQSGARFSRATAVEPVVEPAGTLQRQSELRPERSPPFRGRAGILLVNIGSPASLSTSDVREYLRQFLGDSRVVDLNPLLKWFVLNLFILRKRPKESAEAYANIWDQDRGSPLLFHSHDLAKKLSDKLGEKYEVVVGMQYCEPSVRNAMEGMRARGVDRVIVVPMYPQYASSSTGAAAEIVYKEASKVYSTPYLHTVPAFYDHPSYISSYAKIIRNVVGDRCEKFDHLLMSFHGVPQKHCERTDETGLLCNRQLDCCASIVQANRNCYRAQSFTTARRLADALNISVGKYSIAFQSRLAAAGAEWIKPYTDEELVKLAKAGVKRLAVVVPSFTADCLETLEEIGIRGKEDFIAAGGEHFELIPCLNSDDTWVDGLVEILRDSCPMDTF